jgi:hypothetical protein
MGDSSCYDVLSIFHNYQLVVPTVDLQELSPSSRNVFKDNGTAFNIIIDLQ